MSRISQSTQQEMYYNEEHFGSGDGDQNGIAVKNKTHPFMSVKETSFIHNLNLCLRSDPHHQHLTYSPTALQLQPRSFSSRLPLEDSRDPASPLNVHLKREDPVML